MDKKVAWGLLIGLIVLIVAGVIVAVVMASNTTEGVANTKRSAELSASANLFGADQPHMAQHPLESQARDVHRDTFGHPALNGCYTADPSYRASQDLLQENPALVPPYQAALRQLPAVRSMNYQQEYPGTGIGPNAREGIDTLSNISLDSTTLSEDDDFSARVKQTEGAGVSSIYRRGDGKGIALINQKSRMVDPTKMLPHVAPGRESERMVQAGPSIADIGCRVPKAADIMRLLRASRGSALSHTIPRDRPPVYTEGLNAFRPTPLPASTYGGAGCTIGISPYEVSDLIEYCPNPFLNRSRASEAPTNYSVGPE